MTSNASNAWKIQTPLFNSFIDLMDSFGVFRSALQYKVNLIPDKELANSAKSLLKSMDKAEKVLKLYLFQLTNLAGDKTISSADVITAFHHMSEIWDTIPASTRGDLITTHSVVTYEDSIVKLLSDQSALQAACKDIRISLADIAEDELR